eukprot:scaffold255591_cov45-Prasinocladus_malaysianus.AAC.1
MGLSSFAFMGTNAHAVLTELVRWENSMANIHGLSNGGEPKCAWHKQKLWTSTRYHAFISNVGEIKADEEVVVEVGNSMLARTSFVKKVRGLEVIPYSIMTEFCLATIGLIQDSSNATLWQNVLGGVLLHDIAKQSSLPFGGTSSFSHSISIILNLRRSSLAVYSTTLEQQKVDHMVAWASHCLNLTSQTKMRHIHRDTFDNEMEFGFLDAINRFSTVQAP